MDTNHTPSGGSARVLTMARMSLRAVKYRCSLPHGALGWLVGTGLSGRAKTDHMRNVLGGLPLHAHTQVSQTRSLSRRAIS